ncbi:MAG: sugar nucleotide-binding protein [Planctomycetota bacterium]|nr:sugar nucleotide-binding protein [Planctomycetota bacterium]
MSRRILLLGGSGRLGRELRRVLDCDAPPRSVVDLLRPETIDAAIAQGGFAVVIHAAALVGVRPCEDDRALAFAINAEGTRHVARATARSGARLVYVSTDAVFDGYKGMYREDDLPNPINTYALTKLLGEAHARMVPSHLVVRTSFVPSEGYPYPRAFVDQWTSRLTATQAAVEIARALELAVEGVIHIGGARRRQIDVAREVSPDVGEMTRAETGLALPHDMSLDCSRWLAIQAEHERNRKAAAQVKP